MFIFVSPVRTVSTVRTLTQVEKSCPNFLALQPNRLHSFLVIRTASLTFGLWNNSKHQFLKQQSQAGAKFTDS